MFNCEFDCFGVAVRTVISETIYIHADFSFSTSDKPFYVAFRE